MPISIPTSIAGISVPGAVVSGPLSKLYENKYELERYSYPRNLEADTTRRHVIRFTTRVPDPSVTTTGVASSLKNTTVAATTGLTQAASAGFDIAAGKTNEGVQKISSVSREVAEKTADSFKLLTQADVKRVDKTIIDLYVPDTVNVSYNTVYDDLSLSSTLGKPYFLAQAGVSLFDKYKNSNGVGTDIEKIANAVADDPYVRSLVAGALGNQDLGTLLTAGVGQALNPQLQVIFRGIGFRSFQFDFTLTPYSQQESEQIAKIVKAFKFAAAPEIQKASIFGQGLFYKVPDRFKIQFFYNGQENFKVHRIGECVLENINVDYAPIGWATFGDGTPVQTKLTVQFKETVIIDKTKIAEGY